MAKPGGRSGAITALLLVGAAFAVVGISSRETSHDSDPTFGPADRTEAAQVNRDLFRIAGVDLEGERGGQTYAEFDAARDSEGGEQFEGFTCLGSCEGHEAGWEWAESEALSDPRDCGGNSWSFLEGCVAAARSAASDMDPPDAPDRDIY